MDGPLVRGPACGSLTPVFAPQDVFLSACGTTADVQSQNGKFVYKMKILHLDSAEWLTMLRLSEVAPCASYCLDTQKMVLWFDTASTGRVVLSVARGGPRQWSTEAASRFLAATGLSWTVIPTAATVKAFAATDFGPL